MGSGFENLILFGLLSLMLLIGTLLRAKVKLFQDYLVPASIIGGLIGATFFTLFVFPLMVETFYRRMLYDKNGKLLQRKL